VLLRTLSPLSHQTGPRHGGSLLQPPRVVEPVTFWIETCPQFLKKITGEIAGTNIPWIGPLLRAASIPTTRETGDCQQSY
jgi:hypothetical protein